jgi:hypothetical protein
MMQVGVLSLSQLQLHDHYNFDSGGPILTVTRANSANVRLISAAIVMSAAGVGAATMMKRIVLDQDSPGAMTILHTATRAGGAGTIHTQARVMRAGVSIWDGVDNPTVAGPTIFTDAAIALDLLQNDCIEIWGHVAAGAATICAVEALEVCFDATITSIARWPVTVALAITGPGLDYTVVA